MNSRKSILRIGLVGCGEVTRAKHLPALSTLDNVLIAAVADISADRLERVAREFRVPRRFKNVHELLASADVDAVGICVPPEAHTDTAIAALNAGKHVWIDKPLALTPSECLRIIQAADKTHPIAMTGFHMRFHRLVRQARALLLSGALGSVETVHAIWHSPRGDANIPEWKRKRSLGGGSLIEIAVHHFDLLRYLLKSELADIVAYTRDGTRDDECAVILARMANGVLVTGEFSERAPHAIEITVNGRNALLRLDCLRFDGLELRGQHDIPGSPAVRLKSMQRFLASLPEGIGVMRRGGDYRDSYRLAWNHFVESIRSQREPEATLDDGLRATEAVCGALEAQESGGPVALLRKRDDPINENRKPGTDSRTAGEHRNGLSNMVFSVVIPTFNRPDHVRGVLEALADQDFSHELFEVILVDDGSSSPLNHVVHAFRDRLQVVLLRQANCGCAAARQRGVESARGAYLAFTDDDCRPPINWLTILAEGLTAHPHCAVGGLTFNALTGNLISETTQIVANFLVEARGDALNAIKYCPTSNLAFPAFEFCEIGGMNKTWPIGGGEDRDLCMRWVHAGFKLYFMPGIKVAHLNHMTFRQFICRHFRYGRGAFLFHRHASARSKPHPFEPWSRYFHLLISPLRQFHGITGVGAVFLLISTQFSTACGFCFQALVSFLKPANLRLSSRMQREASKHEHQ